MSAIDFSRSYMRWFNPENNVRILVDAACTITDENSGKADAYYLIAPCRGENTHGDRDLIRMPSFEFCGVWGEDEHLIIRTHYVSERDNRDYRAGGDTLDIRTFGRTQQLSDSETVFKATMESTEPLISRTTIRDESRGITAVLEYPVNTMNVKQDPIRFQVDTGPLIFPDFTNPVARQIESFEVAYVVYNRFDQAEFVLRKPVAVGESGTPLDSITDYSDVRIMPAQNELLLAISD